MANEQNLRPAEYKLTLEEQKRGGKKSGQVRAERKKFNELFNAYLDKMVTSDQIKEQMKQFGFNDEECTNKNAVVFAQYKQALKGNTNAATFIRDTMGEKPVEQIQQLETPKIVDDI